MEELANYSSRGIIGTKLQFVKSPAPKSDYVAKRDIKTFLRCRTSNNLWIFTVGPTLNY